MVDPAPLEPGSIVADRYRLVRLIGTGGMGVVYEVEHVFTKQRRALKLLRRDFANVPEATTRFLREASVAEHIKDHHIAQTFDAGQLPSGEPYLVMELLDGESLADRLERSPRLTSAEAVDIVAQAAAGIQAAHDGGIVHRDLKPDNLFLVGQPSSVKIIDFGISKFAPELTGAPAMTVDNATLGTPNYMSPEQVRRAGEVDAQTDVYALGVVLYECVTGRRPYDAETFAELCILIHEGRFAPPSTLRADVDPKLERIIVSAMAHDRADRYKSAGELQRALSAYRAGVSEFDATLAGTTIPPSAVAAGSLPPPPTRSAPTQATRLSPGGPVAGESRSWLRLSAIAAAAALGIYLLLRLAGASAPPSSEPRAAEPANTARQPPAEPPGPPASATPAPSGPAKPTPSTSAPTLAATPTARSPHPSSSAGSKAAPQTSSRSKQHGLGAENPF